MKVGKTFVDTNVLIDAHDVDQKETRPIAQKALIELMENLTGVLSPQVLQVFYVNVIRKITTPLPRRVARAIVEDFSVWCISMTAEEMSAAFRIEDEAKISFWDA